jgi:glutamine synthetase
VINASDMLVIPDATTAWIDVFNAEPTLSLICTIVDPITRQPYDRDPRGGVSFVRLNSQVLPNIFHKAQPEYPTS